MQVLNLTPSNNVLSRSYSKGDGVLCLCDASDGSFTIYIPDVDDVTFKFKKIDSSSNKVYLSSLFKTIDSKETVAIENTNECKTLEYDGQNWWVTGAYNEASLFS